MGDYIITQIIIIMTDMKPSSFEYISFMFMGNSALLGWNAVLTAFDYFVI